MTLTLYNTLTRRKERFEPIDPNNVRMYVCGPTVYDFAHIGNARPVIVFDVLFRLLRHIYGAEHVTYARNITDVDDKINARAAELGISIRELTERTYEYFKKDVAALGCLEPTFEPRATDHIEEMKKIIERLCESQHAYVANDHVLFDVSSMKDYGQLSHRSLEEMIAGARVEVAPYKKNPMDFVLWKPTDSRSDTPLPSWRSPRKIETEGRPGWHIECSAMAWRYLKETFDIHGGGIDLVFPHHENEIAQSRCAFHTSLMAKYWMHNGFLQVEGQKMSKSLGNFVTINELLETRQFGGQYWHGRVLRLAMLMTHYRQPIDWTADRLFEARSHLYDWNKLCFEVPRTDEVPQEIINALSDDLNSPAVVVELHNLVRAARTAQSGADFVAGAGRLRMALEFLGLYEVKQSVELLRQPIRHIDSVEVDRLVEARNAARRTKNFKEADRIRDELSAMGIQLKDAKDPKTGEVETTWEVKR